ncbi:TolC family outer membrane protein [Thiothrix fructosivorans]|uniref:TolC family outer membrane protein n=1 Tax=Thiothrix fructosivorans TaxID=111770 RepID=A0A8B0SR47_9GAMM|nr:TolC family outer membrane protein [Thiothrix fructosivorans]MBO0611361.1 TolC family outer membrane protein [Thiothrix fructosivorans]QTX13100.1 TolC family outer membrane protein [Thiothrix fructosivorans]
MNKKLLAASLSLLVAPLLVFTAKNAHAENLLQVYQQAKRHDAQLKVQESGHLATLEQRQQARAGLRPQVNLSGNTSYAAERDSLTSKTVDGNQANYALTLGQPLYNQGVKANIAKTDALIGQSAETLESARQDLMVRVAKAYLEALQAQDNLAFAKAEKTAINRQLEQAKAYFEAGRSAITDVKEAEASDAAAQAQEITATQQLDIAREQLRVLTGGFYPALDAPRANMPLAMPTPNSIEAWVNTAKQNNHQLRASQQAMAAAQKGVAVQRAGKLPTVDLFAKQTGSYLNNDTYTNQRSNDVAVGISVSMPLYTGGATTSKIREAQFTFQQTQQAYDLQMRQTEQQVRSAFLGIQSSMSQVTANQQALVSAETAAQATQAGFEVGTRTAVDVLNAVRAEFRARRDHARARYDFLLNTLLLRQAAGTLTEKDMMAISVIMQPKG